jgi:Flp pilus assembly protein TadG
MNLTPSNLRMNRISGQSPATRQRRRGAAAVEFAVIAPLFLLLLAGIMEFGQAFRIQHSLSTAARHGARAATIPGATNSLVTQKVRAHCVATLGVNPNDIAVSFDVNGQPNGNVSLAMREDEITVAISIPYSKAGVGFYAHTFANSTLRAACTLQRE